LDTRREIIYNYVRDVFIYYCILAIPGSSMTKGRKYSIYIQNFIETPVLCMILAYTVVFLVNIPYQQIFIRDNIV